MSRSVAESAHRRCVSYQGYEQAVDRKNSRWDRDTIDDTLSMEEFIQVGKEIRLKQLLTRHQNGI
jgi:hypothetical protein